MLAALATFFLWHPSFPVTLLLMLPLVADGMLQQFTPYESRNGRRVVTGLLFGYALVCAFFISTIFAFQWGVSLGESLR